MHATPRSLLACDVNEEWTRKARGYWRDAGVDKVIELELRPRRKRSTRASRREAGQYDFGFIDADKTGYDAYYERGLKLLRPGGVMLFDNVLWSGRVADASRHQRPTPSRCARSRTRRAPMRACTQP